MKLNVDYIQTKFPLFSTAAVTFSPEKNFDVSRSISNSRNVKYANPSLSVAMVNPKIRPPLMLAFCNQGACA